MWILRKIQTGDTRKMEEAPMGKQTGENGETATTGLVAIITIGKGTGSPFLVSL